MSNSVSGHKPDRIFFVTGALRAPVFLATQGTSGCAKASHYSVEAAENVGMRMGLHYSGFPAGNTGIWLSQAAGMARMSAA